MPAGDLTSVANVKAQTGTGTSTASDAVLQSLVTAVSAFIVIDTDRKFDGAISLTKFINGNGRTEMYLPEGPVQSVTSLSIDNVPIVAQPADFQSGFYLVDDQVLAVYGYTFTRGRRNVKVVFSAGYTAVPKDIEQACIEIVAAAYKRVPRGPELTSETIPAAGAVYSFSKADVPSFAATILDRYRKVVPG